jgi:SAM-dependent methyltransferase
MTNTPAFDPTAHAYDAEFTGQLLGKWLREQVWAHTPFTAPMTMLELGCGTGEDARHFADMGISVLATDASGEMIAVAREKNTKKGMIYHAPTASSSDLNSSQIPPPHCMERGLGSGVEFLQLDLNNLPPTPLDTTPFDAVFSNFGVINCVENRVAVAQFIHDHLAENGVAVIVTMTRTCPIEIVWHLLHLHPKQAIRRFFGGRLVNVGNGGALRVWYPTHRALRKDFARAGLRLERMVGIGVVLPPSYLAPLVARYPRFWGWMRGIEKRLARLPVFNRLNDHTLMVFRKG